MNKQLKALTMERRLASTRLAQLAGKEQDVNQEQPASAKASAGKKEKRHAVAHTAMAPVSA